MKRIARVFPTQTAATPKDALAFYDVPSMVFPPEVDAVHVSVAFTWDRQRAEYLAEQWKSVAPVSIGGPGWNNEPGAEFVPGMYLAPGWTITSRGCPNHCAHCSVPLREPRLRELPIRAGHIVQDDNLLACSERHVKDVFRMLGRQRKKAHLRGLEARLLKPWHIDFLCCLWPAQLWFAYDSVEAYEPLRQAGIMLREAGFDRERMGCYILVGKDEDTFGAAENRVRQVWEAGFMPFAMPWRDQDGGRDMAWAKWAWPWMRPAATKSKACKDYLCPIVKSAKDAEDVRKKFINQ